MMMDILHKVGIAAQAETMFTALTTIEGIRGCWISDAQGGGREGEVFTFRRNHLNVAEATPSLVRWHYSGPATE